MDTGSVSDERALEALVLGPIVLREIIRLIEAGAPEAAAETAREFIRELERLAVPDP